MASRSRAPRAGHSGEWRDPRQIVALWRSASSIDPALLKQRASGRWWEILDSLNITLFVTREYEHLAMAFSCVDGRPLTTYLPIPHPSGIACGPDGCSMALASTRNPNQLVHLRAAANPLERRDSKSPDLSARPMLPGRSYFYPGALYLHDLAYVRGKLHGNTVGLNAVSRFEEDGSYEPVWWPRSIEKRGVPDFSRNYLQLNSIAAGRSLQSSYFTSSAERPGRRRPGHLDFPVDGRGVVFSGATRAPVAFGLTRPHSARFHRDRIWVDNSGYGELAVVDGGRCECVVKLPGWTRGLSFCNDLAFVGTSRVLPRFRGYAPGVESERSVCGIHAIDLKRAQVIGSIVWPQGDQIFAIDWLPRRATSGFPFVAGRPSDAKERELFYAFGF